MWGPGEEGGERGTVLVVDDEESIGRLARRHFVGWSVVQAYALDHAATAVASMEDLRLVLLDLNLGDATYPEPLLDNPFQGSFALAREIRQTRPKLPVIIFSAHCNGAIINATHLCRAEFICKHECAENLRLLRQQLELASRVGNWSALPYLVWLREQRGMTPRELDVAALAVQGITSYGALGDCLGISPNTVKRHVTSLLDRSGADSLFDFIFRARGITS